MLNGAPTLIFRSLKNAQTNVPPKRENRLPNCVANAAPTERENRLPNCANAVPPKRENRPNCVANAPNERENRPQPPSPPKKTRRVSATRRV